MSKAAPEARIAAAIRIIEDRIDYLQGESQPDYHPDGPGAIAIRQLRGIISALDGTDPGKLTFNLWLGREATRSDLADKVLSGGTSPEYRHELITSGIHHDGLD